MPPAELREIITFDVGRTLEFATVIEPPEEQTKVPLLVEGNATAPPNVRADVPDCTVVPIVTPPLGSTDKFVVIVSGTLLAAGLILTAI